jgi:branched-chain amino acid transport system substrate-binding protein
MAANVMGRVSDTTNADAIAAAIAATDATTVVGKIAWNGASVPPFAAKNVCKTPLVGGQWRKKAGGGFELLIVENATAPEIPTADKMEPLS